MNPPVRILLVEDEPAWQAAVSALFEADPRFELAAIADNYAEALLAYQNRHPQAVLLDWQIRGDRDGLEVGHSLLAAGFPLERIVLISGASPSTIPRHPFLYVPKNQLSNDLLPLLVSVTLDSI